jgi:hypothetical protein
MRARSSRLIEGKNSLDNLAGIGVVVLGGRFEHKHRHRRRSFDPVAVPDRHIIIQHVEAQNPARDWVNTKKPASPATDRLFENVTAQHLCLAARPEKRECARRFGIPPRNPGSHARRPATGNPKETLMNRNIVSLLGAATIVVTVAATATDASAQWRGRGWGWGPGIAAGVIGGAVIAGAIIASRPPGYVVYEGYGQPVYGPGCYWASQPIYDAAGRVVGYTGQPVQVCPGYQPPPPGYAGAPPAGGPPPGYGGPPPGYGGGPPAGGPPPGYAGGSPGYAGGPPGGDPVASCMQRFRSYDPKSGTYLGNDGQRHACP